MSHTFQLIGDSHGNWDHLDAAVKASKAHVVIQVGDLGYFPNLGIKDGVPNLPTTEDFLKRDPVSIPEYGSDRVYWIDGNHDDIVSIQKFGFSHPVLEYVHRGATMAFPTEDGREIKVAFLGGGVSLDRRYRTEGIDWFREEVPTWEEFDKFFEAVEEGVDMVVTHEMPETVVSRYFKTHDLYHSSVAVTLDKLVHSLTNPPRYWVSGHYHDHYQTTYRGTKWISVPVCHPHRGRSTNKGVLLSL